VYREIIEADYEIHTQHLNTFQRNFLGQTRGSGGTKPPARPEDGRGATKPPAHPEDAFWVLANHQYTLKMQSWCSARPEDAVLVLPNHQHALKMQYWCYPTTSTP
jgi:hypothetical protein